MWRGAYLRTPEMVEAEAVRGMINTKGKNKGCEDDEDSEDVDENEVAT